MAWDPALERLNARFFQTLFGRDCMIGMDRDAAGEPMMPDYMCPEAFLHLMKGVEQVKVVEGDKPMWKDAAPMWLRHPDRRRFWGVEFNPGKKGHGTMYNLWRGFAVEPKKGAYPHMRAHIEEVVCNGDARLIQYVHGWLARAVQYPGEPAETALVLRGAKGTGKGTFATAIGSLFGPHYLPVSNKIHLVGRFNDHLRDKVVLFVDEGFWAGDVQHEGILKQLITEPELPYEAKYQGVKRGPNVLHVIIASNEQWVVPVSGMERRFCVLDLSDKHIQDTLYFNTLRAAWENGEAQALLYDLLNYDLTSFSHRNPPSTAGLHAQLVHSLRGFEAWWYGRLCAGNLRSGQAGWGRIALSELYALYKTEDNRRPASREVFEMELERAAPGLARDARKFSNSLGQAFVTLPSLDACRKAWEQTHGPEEKWHE